MKTGLGDLKLLLHVLNHRIKTQLVFFVPRQRIRLANQRDNAYE